MEKKLYVLRNGENPGICLDWLSFFQRADGLARVDCCFFEYKTELEDADETVRYSLKWAFACAKAYLGEVYEEDTDEYAGNVSAIVQQVNDFLPDEEDEFDESAVEWVQEEEDSDDPETEVSVDVTEIEGFDPDEGVVELPKDVDKEQDDIDKRREAMKKRREESKKRRMEAYKSSSEGKEDEELDKELRKMLGIREDLHMGSVWLDMLLQLAGGDGPYISGGYTGRYYPPSLYCMLLYLILEPRMILDEVHAKHTCKQPAGVNWYDSIEFELFRSEEYKWLKEHFEKNGMTKLDIKDVLHINTATVRDRKLLKMRPSYFRMQRFLQSGQHTIVDLYNELVGTNMYREELVRVSGGLVNPELATKKVLEEGNKQSLDELVEVTNRVSRELKEYIVGQDAAIDKLEQAFFHSEKEAISKDKKGPRSVFLFAGPPGVGKTFMAEHFARALDMDYHRFDMANYGSYNAMEEIIGISSFYVNSKAGVLTSYVDEHPRRVLLFDEIEKADISVIKLFLQILDEGKCFDRYMDANVSFKDCIIIMTTNVGRQMYENTGNERLAELPDKVIIKGLQEDINPSTKTPYFPPEIVSRMASHTIIMFNHLKASAIRKVIKRDVEKNLELNKINYGFDISKGSDIVAATVQFAVGGGGDARNASKLAGKLIDKEIYELFSLIEEKTEGKENVQLKQISWECDFAEASDEIREFYLGEKNCVVPILKETDKEYTIRINKMLKVMVVCDTTHFMDIVRKENTLFAVVEYAYGLKAEEASMSISDVRTTGSKALLALKDENQELPVYLLKDDKKYRYSESEQRKLYKMGVEGFIDEANLTAHLLQAYSDICCKNALELLKVRHQIMTYATRKEISQDNMSAKIIFYNLKLEMAVDAEDKDTLISDDLRPDKKWSDIFVSSDIRKELEFFIKYLKEPREYSKTGARAPRGALMFGPPGTGKTSLAKVVASESKVNFLSVSADELVSGGANKVHDIFRVARKYAPAVLFIDEIDAVGISRGMGGANATLNALLTEMDGFKRMDGKPVFVMAATNLNAIDAALVRRFDRSFVVGLPNEEGRRWVLKRLLAAHSKMFSVSEKEIDSIVIRSQGMSPADLENIIETALREGIRNGKAVTDALLDEVFEKSNKGEKYEVSSEKEVEHTAYHEAGHAVIELYYGYSPEYMSVVARSDIGGYVRTEKMNEHPTKERLLQKICTSMGGRAAELEFGYGLTPGAAGDLKHATALATQMVCKFGMYEEEMGLMVLSEDEFKTNEQARALVNKILKEQLEQARQIIRENKDAVGRLVEAVLHNGQKYLTKKDIMDAYKGME